LFTDTAQSQARPSVCSLTDPSAAQVFTIPYDPVPAYVRWMSKAKRATPGLTV